MLNNLHYFYEIDGLNIAKAELNDPKYRFIEYKAFLCRIVIATDDMGTNICYNGNFFGGFFPNLEMAVIYLRQNRLTAIPLFRKVYLNYIRYLLSKRHFGYKFRAYKYRSLKWLTSIPRNLKKNVIIMITKLTDQKQ